MFNAGLPEIVVILAMLGLVVGAFYSLITFVVRRELRKREGS
jgi:hypothetical protein